ncbi:helix-turn-helix domain-containing protein [Frankia sp. Mgl5]|uniref:helix-turn-helix transcriptional regulator n=1 Tax=Frankia sp. Mgl5 TaxID=2933793 RepID=UPI00200E17D3|nr:helix-turn-helix transcriptional regulator [Frankia sp. Mgl5]MCK9932153.1 helix-turn-helix domain-containing protein [Frankia sp. Mgl5]
MAPSGKDRRGLADRRKAQGLSQEALANLLGVERSTVYRWERGETDPQPSIRPLIANTLQISLDDLSELLCASKIQPNPADITPDPVSYNAEILAQENGCDIDAKFREPIDDVYLGRARVQIRQLLEMEHLFGGERISGVALDSAQSFERKISASPIVRGMERDVFATAAEFFEVAGWFLVDTARHSKIREVNSRALHYCGLSGDRSMEIFVIQNMSMHASESDRPSEALNLARGILDRQVSPRIEALFLAREARALAARGEESAIRSFAAAQSCFSAGVRNSDPSWSWWVDDTEFLIQESLMYADLQEWERAAEILGGHVDSASIDSPYFYFCLAHLARIQTGMQAWEDAETTSTKILGAIEDISSSRIKGIIQRYTRQIIGSDLASVSAKDAAHALRLAVSN